MALRLQIFLVNNHMTVLRGFRTWANVPVAVDARRIHLTCSINRGCGAISNLNVTTCLTEVEGVSAAASDA